MNYYKIDYPVEKALELSDFRDMDYYAVENYHLPIELMMENAGLQLARMVADFADLSQTILIGIGNGNNGGGGLVAARRLSAWGYQVHLDLFTHITQDLPNVQLERALKFGAKLESVEQPDIWIDAYLGFSQHLPLNEKLLSIIEKANVSNARRVSLDIPTGFLGDKNSSYFKADKVLTLAAPKRILYNLPQTEIYVADLGIPKKVYEYFNVEMLPFEKAGIVRIK